VLEDGPKQCQVSCKHSTAAAAAAASDGGSGVGIAVTAGGFMLQDIISRALLTLAVVARQKENRHTVTADTICCTQSLLTQSAAHSHC
jgi:hypothetical protein